MTTGAKFEKGDRVKFVTRYVYPSATGDESILPGETGTVIESSHRCTQVRMDVGNRTPYPYDYRLKLITDNQFPDAKPTKSFDNVKQPKHYAGTAIEVIDAIEAWGLHKNAYLKDVVKYVARHEKKNGIEDLKKAHMFLTREINRLEGRASWEKGWA